MNTTTQVLKCKNEGCLKDFMVIQKEADLYKRKNLPNPDFCPECRHRQRKLYKRTCDHCQNTMLSTYPETAPYKIYCQKCFWENIG